MSKISREAAVEMLGLEAVEHAENRRGPHDQAAFPIDVVELRKQFLLTMHEMKTHKRLLETGDMDG